MKSFLKQLAELAALIFVLPILAIYSFQATSLGRNRAFAAVAQRAAKWTGLKGEYLRRVLFARLAGRIGKNVVISFGTLLTKPAVELAEGVYLGAYCVLGDVRVGENTLIGDHVCIPSGSHQHGFARLDLPIREQPGTFQTVHIGCDCWIGSAAVILADIGDHCIVAAGAVVTQPVPDYAIVAGNPARVLADRREKSHA